MLLSFLHIKRGDRYEIGPNLGIGANPRYTGHVQILGHGLRSPVYWQCSGERIKLKRGRKSVIKINKICTETDISFHFSFHTNLA